MELGNKLRLLRVLKGFRQEEVAVALGVSRSVVVRYEAGTMAPRDRIIAKYAKILGNVSFEWLKNSTIPAFWSEAFRPLSPYARYTRSTIRPIVDELSRLSEILDVLGIDAVQVLESELGHIIVAASTEVTFAIIGRQEISDALLCSIPAQNRVTQKIENSLFFQAITNPVQQIERVLYLCNVKAHIDPQKMCLSYAPPSDDVFQGVSIKVDISEGTPEIVNSIRDILVKAGINVTSVDLLHDSASETQLDPEFKAKAISCGLEVR